MQLYVTGLGYRSVYTSQQAVHSCCDCFFGHARVASLSDMQCAMWCPQHQRCQDCSKTEPSDSRVLPPPLPDGAGLRRWQRRRPTPRHPLSRVWLRHRHSHVQQSYSHLAARRQRPQRRRPHADVVRVAHAQERVAGRGAGGGAGRHAAREPTGAVCAQLSAAQRAREWRSRSRAGATCMRLNTPLARAWLLA